ncbi:hypothetical protein TRIUR3_34224 [Triticum urartu]|uniref:Uncharacterized protein n=1 Tax=Triticum urartu TaxID=4572 RepID=M8AL88_TRIUA|nr:uncharacterized protein LOC125535159 [Triticum urartu]EMS65850.1 hypothetical protein TRIUR3_34224 [Triticum urartu]
MSFPETAKARYSMLQAAVGWRARAHRCRCIHAAAAAAACAAMTRTKGRTQSCAPRCERPWPRTLLVPADARDARERGLAGDSDGADGIAAEGWPGALARGAALRHVAGLGPPHAAVRPMESLHREHADNVLELIERQIERDNNESG